MSGVGRGPMLSPLGFDLRSLEAFVVTCRKGSMAAAAQRLSMSQPAISQIIKCLETSLGVALIDRSHRPLRLTAKWRFPARSSGRFACRCSAHSLAAARNRKRISAGPAHRDCRFTRIALRAGSPLEFSAFAPDAVGRSRLGRRSARGLRRFPASMSSSPTTPWMISMGSCGIRS